jgi:hypothetical protein
VPAILRSDTLSHISSVSSDELEARFVSSPSFFISHCQLNAFRRGSIESYTRETAAARLCIVYVYFQILVIRELYRAVP